MSDGARYLVLLSGGMDSVAALHWALMRTTDRPGIRALFVAYGQPQEETERQASWRIAARRGVPWSQVDARSSALGHLQAMRRPEPGTDETGLSLANVPGRNLLLVGCAVAEALRTWPRGGATILLGCNATDVANFQDCGPNFLEPLGSATMAYNLQVRSPWSDMTKAEIVDHFTKCVGPSAERARFDLLDSVSYYHGTNCGECDACAERAKSGLHTLETREAESCSADLPMSRPDWKRQRT